jgi:hypothetical protein
LASTASKSTSGSHRSFETRLRLRSVAPRDERFLFDPLILRKD